MDKSHPYDKTIFNIETITVANPALGTPYVVAMPTESRFQLQTIYFRLQTSAVPGNRQIYMVVYSGARYFQFAATHRLQAPGSLVIYFFVPGSINEVDPAAADPYVLQGIGHEIIIDKPSNLIITAWGLDGGDQFQTLTYSLRTWRKIDQL